MSDIQSKNVQPDEQFWELADSFIRLANEHCGSVPRSRVSATLLYAASRFNAFVVGANAKTKDQFSTEKENAATYFLGQYEKMLRENLDDYERHYQKYVGNLRERPANTTTAPSDNT